MPEHLSGVLLASSPGSLFLCGRGAEKESLVSSVWACLKITQILGNRIPLYITVKLYSNLIRTLATVFVLHTETASAVSSLAVKHALSCLLRFVSLVSMASTCLIQVCKSIQVE